MASLAQRYHRLKTSIGGNREKRRYEETFGMPHEEQAYITPPNAWQRRILGELEFVLRLESIHPDLCGAPLSEALTLLQEAVDNQGTLTRQDVVAAEAVLAPVAGAVRAYSLILAGHAHIDMNWMWSWQETVAATLDTFRTMLALMEEYPAFHFSQSQASVYHIVEEFDPDMMARIRERIAEGRWEVTASSWVEQDKNMPSTESMARHLLYTKQYLHRHWGIDPDSLDIDFSPDTFGHSGNMPEILSTGGVKYYYHCRATNDQNILYRWKAPSGREVLVYREPYWYNSGITPHIGSGLLEISKKCGGLKTGLIVYGVGDHGGGPTRRDIERAMEMMSWPIYPRIRFGTIREFFKEAEAVREQLPVNDKELNYIFTGCYTTQSRIKAGNRKAEAALYDAEALTALTRPHTGKRIPAAQFEKAWQNVLFTHFHDILTGSCVQDAREHAMALYGDALAIANTQRANAMRELARLIDTSRFPADADLSQTQAEGAGPGYGIELLSVPGPSMANGTGGFAAQGKTRAAGIKRIFHLFNASADTHRTVSEFTVWDWTGDLARLRVFDESGNALPHQLVDTSYRHYWDHKYVRVLVETELPALGYATVLVDEAPMEEYPFFHQPDDRTDKPQDDWVMDNGLLRAVFDRRTALLVSLVDKESGVEFIRSGEAAGLRHVETENQTSSAWKIGRRMTETPVDRCVKAQFSGGTLRQQLEATFPFAGSSATLCVSLDKGATALSISMEIDWHEVGKKDTPIPMLCYAVPLARPVPTFLYDVPGGIIERPPLHQDVPGLTFGAAVQDNLALALVSDCKYGFRGADDRLDLTLIHAPTNPDPDPERGLHRLRLALVVSPAKGDILQKAAFRWLHPTAYLAANAHAGKLPACGSLLSVNPDASVVLSGIKAAEEGDGLIVRFSNTESTPTDIRLTLPVPIAQAVTVDTLENPVDAAVSVDDKTACLTVAPYATVAVRINTGS